MSRIERSVASGRTLNDKRRQNVLQHDIFEVAMKLNNSLLRAGSV